MAKMRYRLALDLGSTSLGWAMVRLDADDKPCAIIKAGVRIFSDGRNPKDGSSLAVTRRDARAMRRRRDRLLKRKACMMDCLIRYGFFPAGPSERKALERLNPYALRAQGLDQALAPGEFARALFHINQRRGFKSNRKTKQKEDNAGALKTAISKLRQDMHETGCRTVGEWLHRRDLAGLGVRARYRQTKVTRDNGKPGIDKSYDLYIDRAMIEAEFDLLWAQQAQFNPVLFNEPARQDLRHCLLFQRPLKPAIPGRCTFLPQEARAPLALPSVQRLRIYQEVNHLRIWGPDLREIPLSLAQRDQVVALLEKSRKVTFTKIKKVLGQGHIDFNLEDVKRTELNGNATQVELAKDAHFGAQWLTFSEAEQDAIVMQLVTEQNEATLIRWLCAQTGIDAERAERIANAGLPEGYGSLSARALASLLPVLRAEVITYDKAVVAAGLGHHSDIGAASTGEILPELPYYAIPLQRHVGFGSGQPEDSDEKRYGKIANPTVHIGLNQVRCVVNALIRRYGHPSEVIVELARELKQSKAQRERILQEQADLQRRNAQLRALIAQERNISEEQVHGADIQKMILWQELSYDAADRRCPYSGIPISVNMLLSDQVEIEHILPFSETLDDSLNNKTVATRHANRIKGNHTPWAASSDFEAQGWAYANILERAKRMPKRKGFRFGEDAMAQWLKDEAGYLPRALNDTRYLSRIAKEYLSLICPHNTRAIPGNMTAMLRGKFGLNKVLGLNGEKNRNDHRHHAVDACVIGVTDQGMLQRFANASAHARKRQLSRLVENMPMPWGTDHDRTYYQSVKRAIDAIKVSHKPDHGHEGAMFDATIYSPEGKSTAAAKVRTVIPFSARAHSPAALQRHGEIEGQPKPYKGLLSNSNDCFELYLGEDGSWNGHVLSTYDAYQKVRQYRDRAEGIQQLRNPRLCANGRPLICRLMIGDYICACIDAQTVLLQVLKINSSGSVTFVKPNETNISARYAAKLAAQKAQQDGKPYDEHALNDEFFRKAFSAQSLRSIQARHVTISPIGELNDPGFKD